MLSSLLSSTVFMVGSGSALASVSLIGYLLMNNIVEVRKTQEEIKAVFFPVIFTLLIIFVSCVIAKAVEILV